MSKSIKIGLDLGDGLTIDSSSNKAVVDYVNNGNIILDTGSDPNENGIYVQDLNGADGTGGGSTYDGYTMFGGTGQNMSNSRDRITPFPDVDRSICQLIFTLGLYLRSRRNATSINYSSTVKSVDAMCNEINAPAWYNPAVLTSFRPNPGEMLQLVDHPNFRIVAYNGSTIAVENGDRNNDNIMTTKVIFVILDIKYMSDVEQGGSDYIVHDMKLKCIYSDNVSEYIVGNEYTGIYNPTNTTPGDLM